MISRFRNRAEAGRLLGRELSAYAGRTDVLVLALPGGQPPVDVRGRTVIPGGRRPGHRRDHARGRAGPALAASGGDRGGRAGGSACGLRGAVRCGGRRVCVLQPPTLDGVGLWYQDFTQTEDAEVRVLLERARAAPAA